MARLQLTCYLLIGVVFGDLWCWFRRKGRRTFLIIVCLSGRWRRM